MSQLLSALDDPCTGRAPAVSASDMSLARAQLGARADTLAKRLAELPEGSVALWLDNGLEWVVADLATIRAGRACVPVPHFFGPEQRAHMLESAGVCAVLTDRPCALNDLAPTAAQVEVLEPELTLVELARERTRTSSLPPETAKVTFTSGTTGRPKGVCLSQQAMETVATSVVSAVEPVQPRRHLCVLPLATLLENVAGVYATLLAGAECILPPLAELGWSDAGGLDPVRFVQTVESYRPESLILVPELLLALVCAAEAGFALPDSLRFVAVGGARVAPSLLERAADVGLPIFEGYGLSECSSVVTLNRPGAVRPGSAGPLLPHARVRVAEDGELFVSGGTLQGYVGEAPATAAEYATGDLGHLDDDGFLHIRGRKRNVFITSLGRNVSPEWLEAELTASADIAQAFVCGEARPWIAAVIVPRGPQPEERVRAAVNEANQRLPGYAHIGAWLVADGPFTAENGLATANGRSRRDAIAQHYQTRIDALYRSEGEQR